MVEGCSRQEEELMQTPRGRKGLKMLAVQEKGQCGQVPWSLEGGDGGRKMILVGAGQELAFQLFQFLGWLSHHLASSFTHFPGRVCGKKEAGSVRQRGLTVIGTLCLRRLRLPMQTPHCRQKQWKKNQKIERERANHPLQPLLSMQSEGHMEINIFGSDNTVFLGVLIKRRRLLNTLLLRARLRKPMLLFILNSDELSRAAHTPRLSLSPLQAGIGGE